MRALLPLLLLLAACQKHEPSASDAVTRADPATPPLPTIACIVAGAAGRCTVERIEEPAGLVLLVHHPDGGFRRLTVTDDGRGVAAADGAERAQVRVVDPGTIEVALGGDRYRLPATIGA